jgi:osmoprotectant transport system ATP-binding protein
MIQVKNLVKNYGGIRAVDHLSFEVHHGETLCLIGPSGCGKSTTLKMINRLVEPDGGTIRIEQKNIHDHDPIQLRRRMGYVSQQGSLFPHWNVRQNMSLVPRLEGWDKEKTRARILELMELIRLNADPYLDKYPAELSGGEQQRISIGRALAIDPPILLMDEPFSALDPLTRIQLQNEFLEIKKMLRKTTLFVTHDLQEAFILGDHILLMDSGQVMQYGTQKDLRQRPANEFVENFINAQTRAH